MNILRALVNKSKEVVFVIKCCYNYYIDTNNAYNINYSYIC